MPRTQRRRKSEADPDAPLDPEKENGNGAAPAEATPITVVEPVEPDPEAEAEPAPEKRRRGGAQVNFTARGSADEVREAVSRMTPVPPKSEGKEPEEEPEPEVDEQKIVQLLQDPKNAVTVTRLYPRRWKGQRVDVRCDKYKCPISLEDVEDDIFGRFGGKRFLISIHSNTPTGETRPLYAFAIENPDTDEPWFDEPEPEPIAPVDPTIVPDDNPIEVVRKAIRDKTKVVSEKIQLREAKKMLRDLEKEESDEDPKPKTDVVPVEDPRVRQLQEQVMVTSLKSDMDRKFDRLQAIVEKVIDAQSQAPARGAVDGESGMVKLMLGMMQSNDARFTTMMTTLMGQQNKKQEGIEEVLDKLAKFKQVFGADDPRTKRIEDMLMNVALDRLTGEGGGDDESDVKFAVKQVVPLARQFIEKKLEGGGGEEKPAISQEEYKRLVKEEALKIAKGMAEDWQKRGYLVKLPGPGEKHALPAPAPSKVGAPAATKKTPPKQEPKPEPEKEEEGDEVKAPPSPQSPNYDRKKAVDFVLDTILDEADHGCPVDGYAVGDILDRLDDELLDGLLKISTGNELEGLIGPHASPEKLALIKEKGKKPEVKSWLTRILVTAQDEFRRELSEGEGEAAEKEA